jgi:hypothetical protein
VLAPEGNHIRVALNGPKRSPSAFSERGGHRGDERLANLLVDVLAEAEVRRVFGVSGDSLNRITDSIRASRKLNGTIRAMKKRQHVRPMPKVAFPIIETDL